MTITTFSFEQARKKLEYYCAYQDRCHVEVQAKLGEFNIFGPPADEIITHLIIQDFLNEERFARSFARGKHRIKGWGKSRIVKELKARQITQANIQVALAEINDNYEAAFEVLAEKIWDGLSEKNQLKKKKKFCDQLLRKGFEPDLIYNKLAILCGH